MSELASVANKLSLFSFIRQARNKLNVIWLGLGSGQDHEDHGQ